MKYKRYDKNYNYSYSFGQFPTIELIKSGKAKILSIICHEKLKLSPEIEKIFDYCKNNGVEIIWSSKQIEAICGKENCYLVGVFSKYNDKIKQGNHIVLVSPSNSGNLGTIIRTMLGRNIENLAIIESGKKTDNEIELSKSNTSVDIFNPKVIRASMGSIFNINIDIFHSFDDYKKRFDNKCFAFCLEGSSPLESIEKTRENFSLVFGNEATGLPSEIVAKCSPVRINQSSKIDSFNLAISVAMAIYEFTK